MPIGVNEPVHEALNQLQSLMSMTSIAKRPRSLAMN
jgi:hypothetical protein